MGSVVWKGNELFTFTECWMELTLSLPNAKDWIRLCNRCATLDIGKVLNIKPKIAFGHGIG